MKLFSILGARRRPHIPAPATKPCTRTFAEAWGQVLADRDRVPKDRALAEDATLAAWGAKHGMTSEELDPSPPGRKGHFMRLASGTKYWPIDPRPEEVFIDDIAVSLARQCRFNGHIREDLPFYSVAEHSILISFLVPREWRLEALLHDSPEFAIGDIIRPIKVLPEVAAVVKPIEERNERVIAERFGLKWPFHPCIKAADTALCGTELLTVMRGAAPNGAEGRDFPAIEIPCWSPADAQRHFLNRFFELIMERDAEKACLAGETFFRPRIQEFMSPVALRMAA